jgi:hypothetical protein
MDNEFLKYVKPKEEKKEKPRPADPVASENAAQNLAPAYDAAGNYLGMEVVAPPAANNAYGEDVIKAVKSFSRGADAVVRGAADTLTLGSIDRLSAGLGAATGIGGEFGEYSKNLEAQRAASRVDQEERGPLRLMGQIAGGVVGPAKGLQLLQNATRLPGRAVGGAVAGASAGVPYGYFSSDADLNSMAAAGDALKGGAAGAVIGGAAPVVGNAIGRAVDFVRNRVSPDQFSTLPRVTQRNLESLSRDMDLQRVQAEATRLGPNAMLADVSPDMRLVAQNAATRPGVSPLVADPLRARDAARNERLSDVLDNTLGPNVDRIRVNDRLQALRTKTGEQYPKLAATTPDQMPAYSVLQSIDTARSSPLGRSADVASAMNKIETVLQNPQANGAYGRSAAEFHAAREVADGILNSANTPDHVKRAVQAVRNELDDALKSNVGGWPKLDAKFSDIAGRQEAFQSGQTIFNNGREALRPAEDLRYWQNLNRKQQTADRLGARAELDRIVGQSGNDLSVLNSTLKERGDDAFAKLQTRFGPENTNRLYDARDAERIFADTNNRVNNGSQTAQRQGANQLLSAGSETAGAGAPTSIPEMVMAARKRFSDAVRDAAYGKVNEDSARQLARMTVAQGPERDAFIRALQGRANRTDPELDIERTLKALRPGAVAGLLSDGRERKRQQK